MENKIERSIFIEPAQKKQLKELESKLTDEEKARLEAFSAQERQKIIGDLATYLTQIDATNIETKKDAFSAKINKFIEDVTRRLEIKTKIEQLAGGRFKTLYSKLTEQGVDIQQIQVDKLEKYTEESSKIGGVYRENAAYFMKDQMPDASNDPTLKLYLNEEIAMGILTAKLDNSTELLQEFKEITEKVQEKREQCQQLEAVMKEMAFGKQAQNLASDRGKIIEIYAVLVDKHKIPISTISTVLKKVVYSEEFAAIAETGWNSAEDFKNFVIETVLRGDVKVALEQLKSKKEIIELNAHIRELSNEIQSFKAEFTKDGELYKYCIINKEITSNHAENRRGNFSNLIKAEGDLALAKSRRTMVLIKLSSGAHAEQLRSQYLIEQNDAEEKAAILQHENLLKGELMYRQMVESGAPIDNEVVENAVLARKENRMMVLSISIQKLQNQIQQSVGPVEQAMAEYGRLDLVPSDKKLQISQHAEQLLMLLGLSNQYISQSKALDIEIKLIKARGGLIKEEEKSLSNQSDDQKDLFAKVGEFVTGEKEVLPDPDISSPEIQGLMLGKLKGPVSERIASSVDNLVESSQATAHYFESQLNSKSVQLIKGSHVTLLNIGIEKTEKMREAIHTGRQNLLSVQAELYGAMNEIPPLIKGHSALTEAREKLIKSLIKGVDNLLQSEFSVAQEKEVIKAKDQLQNAKDDLFWDAIKFTIVFALSVGSALVGSGLFAAGANRLSAIIRAGYRARGAITYASGNIALGAVVTLNKLKKKRELHQHIMLGSPIIEHLIEHPYLFDKQVIDALRISKAISTSTIQSLIIGDILEQYPNRPQRQVASLESMKNDNTP